MKRNTIVELAVVVGDECLKVARKNIEEKNTLVKGLGCVGFKDLWYFIGGGLVLEDSLEPLIDDTSAMHMANLARLNVIHMFEYINDDEGDVGAVLHESNECVGKVGGQCEGHNEEFHEGEEDSVVEVEGHGDIQQELHEGEEDGDDVEKVKVNVMVTYKNKFMRVKKVMVMVTVECDINGDIDEEWSGNVEVEVESLSHEFSGQCSNDSSHNNFDDDVRGLSNEEWKYEELVSATYSDEEVNDNKGYERFATFSMPKSIVLEAIKGYALENETNIKFVKSDKTRLRLKCMGAKGKCSWIIYCAYMEVVKSWQLRTVKDKHICSREFNLKLLDAKWLCKMLEKIVRENPKVKGVDIREKVQRKAKTIASDHIDESFKEQYKKIYDYAHELLTRNPGSTVKVHVEDNEGNVMFKRFYSCLKGCKDKFVSYKPIIGLDGAFLKGKYGCELLMTVGRDANDQMLPIAYVVVERFCVRNLYANFRRKYPGKNLKHLMWRTATTTHLQTWEMEMINIKDVNEDAFMHLIVIPPKYWLRSRFTTTTKCDTLVNNMSEEFNSVLVHTRSKPIITMLEDIRVYIMQRWARNKSNIQSFPRSICPKIQTRLRKEPQLTKH
ncbi:hypothetical protein V8G54_028984 [Vigna mungo]|uniref:Transposase MuDR plant domain-containing protein n=1 Tax=Vigna mungo TaxID=3915 RepID=A0AAQ3MTS2_VIGMU